MFKRTIYLVFFLFVITVGIALSLKLGYAPQPVGIMKPSHFENAKQIGAAVYRRFYVPIEEKKLLVFGIPPQPDFHRSIIRGLLEAANIEKRPFDLIISEADMPQLNFAGLPQPEIKVVRANTDSQAEVIDAITQAEAGGRRTLLYIPSVFSSHLLEANPIDRLEKTMKRNFFTITSGPLALRPDQEYVVDPVCIGAEVDGQGTAPLGCAIMRAGRGVYRKKISQDKWVAMMNDQKREDYLLMVSPPNQDKTEAPSPTPPAKPPGL